MFFVRETYSEEEANRLIAEMNKGIDNDELIIHNYQMNPLETDGENAQNTHFLFLGESEIPEVFKPIALNHGFKIVNKDRTVETVGSPQDVTPVFNVEKLTAFGS